MNDNSNSIYTSLPDTQIPCPMCGKTLKQWYGNNDTFTISGDCIILDYKFNHFSYRNFDNGYKIYIYNYPFYIKLYRVDDIIGGNLYYYKNCGYHNLKYLSQDINTMQAIDLIKNLDHLKLFI